MIRSAGPWLGVLVGVLVTFAAALGADPAGPMSQGSSRSHSEAGAGPKVKVPVALAWGPDGRLHVALREARRVIAVDPDGWRVVADWPVPIRPASLAVDESGRHLLVGGADGEALVLDRKGAIVRTLPSGKGPTRLLSLPGGQLAVASLWDAAVRVLRAADGRLVATQPLPFPAGAMARLPDGRIVVADAFGGRLATFDPVRPGDARIRPFEGTNLGALAVAKDGRELLVVHMEQTEPAPITVANIDRGLILSSRLSGVELRELVAEAVADEPVTRRQVTLDGPVHGAADPRGLALSPDGTKIAIALSGSHQVILSDRTAGSASLDENGLLPLGHNQRLQVLEVGRSPAAIVFDPTGRFLVTADSMSDRLTVINASAFAQVATVELNSTPPVRTPAQRGEALFLDGRRSLDRWMSCSSCHNSGHTNGLSFDTLGDGGFGSPKNTPSLLGVKGTEPSAWNGSLPRLADQVHQSLETSLRGPEPAPDLVRDLVAYLEELKPPPPRRSRDEPAVQRGLALFRSRRCEACHKPPTYTTPGVRDVGFDDGSGGNHRFNPPSLRGVGWSSPYFHDGRAASLDAALEIHHPGQDQPLSRMERADLIAFLESL